MGGGQEIPAAILANNLFGIDIDLRAVQLSALALYSERSHITATRSFLKAIWPVLM